mgnify:CR=1 FL=1
MKKHFILFVSILLFLPIKSFAQERSKMTAVVVENAVLASGKLMRIVRFPSKNIVTTSKKSWSSPKKEKRKQLQNIMIIIPTSKK